MQENKTEQNKSQRFRWVSGTLTKNFMKSA